MSAKCPVMEHYQKKCPYDFTKELDKDKTSFKLFINRKSKIMNFKYFWVNFFKKFFRIVSQTLKIGSKTSRTERRHVFLAHFFFW